MVASRRNREIVAIGHKFSRYLVDSGGNIIILLGKSPSFNDVHISSTVSRDFQPPVSFILCTVLCDKSFFLHTHIACMGKTEMVG